MEKLIKTICGLFFILCLSSKSYASPMGLQNYPWTLQQMPIWCGPLEMVNEALKNEGYEIFFTVNAETENNRQTELHKVTEQNSWVKIPGENGVNFF